MKPYFNDDFSKQLMERSLSGMTGETSYGICPICGKDPCECVNLVEETIELEEVKKDGKDDNGFDSCWKGYKKVGTKIKGGKEVNDCVKANKEEYDTDTSNQLWSEVSERLEKLGELDGAKFKVIGEKRDMPGNQEKIDANKNGKIDAHDFAILRNKKSKKTVREMWQIAAEAKKVEIEIMPEIDDKDSENIKKKESKKKS
jgi:hypothetical protein